MKYLTIKDKGLLYKYMLHAKHKKIDERTDKCAWLNDEDSIYMLGLAKTFINH